MTKTKKDNTFLLGHARRMREYRKRQRQQNLEEYKRRVNAQQRDYRLRNRLKFLLNSNNKEKLQTTLKMRQANKLRQRRYRLNQSDQQKKLRQEKDRIYRKLKRNQKQLLSSNKPPTYTVNKIFQSDNNFMSLETVFYRCSSTTNQ